MESPANEFLTAYVPRDEEFGESKREALDLEKLKAILRHIIPTLTKVARDSDVFKGYSDIRGLYRDNMSSTERKTMMDLPFSIILNKVLEFLKFDPIKLDSSKHHLYLNKPERTGVFSKLTLNTMQSRARCTYNLTRAIFRDSILLFAR